MSDPERPEEHEEGEEPDERELDDFDFADPLKRDDDEHLPGLDPMITIPPEE